MQKLHSPHELQKLRKKINSRRDPERVCVSVCSGTGCLAYGSKEVYAAFEREIEKQELQHKVDLRRTGCHGFCEHGPIVVILPEKICYLGTKEKDVPEIVSKTLIKKELVDRLLYKDLETGKRITHMDDIPFYKFQKRTILASNAQIDPKKIDDYIAIGGYSAAAKVLFKMSRDSVIEEIKKSGLRGRGGAGFLAGLKWDATKNAPGEPKYVVVNADEGDPGAYMDRSLLEGSPHSIVEGLIIGSYAIGSHDGFIYVRQEYPLALENTEIAIEEARDYGLLGKDILGSGFDFDVTIHKGAGAFVSGEETALIHCLEGKIGEPRPRPPYPAYQGINDKPTNINNVETWANVPFIIDKGADWFKSIGTETSKGTKIFSLVGKVNNTGLVEVPMGITLREIVYDIGGGVPNGKKFKAVQTGGPSGGVLPKSILDIPVDFDELTKAGSIMGSGGMIVMDEDTCMVDTARYYTEFLAHESCGKCVPCREGLRQMLKILNNITRGKGKEGDIELLEELGEFMQEASLCALGKTAPNPVLSTIKHFRDEYESHIKEKFCPAGVCKELFIYYIDPDKCIGCGLCAKNCLVDAIYKIKDVEGYEINQEKCIKCGSCMDVCPEKIQAVKKVSRKPVAETA